jgi:hypothetical protein
MPTRKEQDGDAELGQQVDLLGRLGDVQHRRAGDDADRDEAHDQGLAGENAEKAHGAASVKRAAIS